MISSGSQRRYAEHYELLLEVIHERFGKTAMNLVKVLCDHGPLTLREIADVARCERFSTTNHLSAVGNNLLGPTSSGSRDSGTNGENFSVSTCGSSSRHGAILEEIFSAQSSTNIGQLRAALTEPSASISAGAAKAAAPAAGEMTAQEHALVDDVNTKKAAIMLVQHGVVEHSEVEKTYRVRLGYGLLHCCFYMVVLRHVKLLHGAAGEKLVELIHSYGLLPCNALLSLATQQTPSLHSAFAAALAELRASAYIVPLPDYDDGGFQSDAKRPRRELTSPSSRPSAPGAEFSISDASMTIPCTINYTAILHKLRQDAIIRLVRARVVDETAAKICSLIFAHDATARISGGPDRADGFPSRSDMSKPLPASQIRAVCDPAPSDPALMALISKLEMPSGRSPVDGTPGKCLFVRSSSLNTPTDYRISYARAAEILREECCEQCVFSRHGVLGVRIVKRLLVVHILDDRMIAEECIATLTNTREVLCALMRDGIVRQQEVPVVVSVERPPKLSQFLWALEREQLENVVRLHLVKSLRNARLRLLHEQKKRKDDPTLEVSGTERAKRLRQQEVVERALECSILALINAIMVMDYF